MALLLLPWALVGVRWVWPGALAGAGLAGVQRPVMQPTPTAADIWSGAFQRRYTAYFGQHVPLLAWAVALKNQLYFSVLHQSGTPGVIIGKHMQLFEPEYIDEYCSRNSAAILAGAEPWAIDLAQLQRWYAEQGRVFIYVVTPSKAAMEPQYIPGRCRSPPSDRDALLPGWNAMLDRHGVRHVDAAGLVGAAQPNYPFAMFPRGGTHWNEVAAALATQAVVRAADRASLPPFAFTWHMAAPDDVARDLTDLLNLPSVRLDDQVPAVDIQSSKPAEPCRPPNIGMVGGSFTFEIVWTLMRLPCPPAVAFYPYFNLMYAAFPGDVRVPVDPAQREDELLRRADIVVLEENEQVAMRSAHGPALYALIARQHAAR